MPTWKDVNQILINSPVIHELLLITAKLKRSSDKKLDSE